MKILFFAMIFIFAALATSVSAQTIIYNRRGAEDAEVTQRVLSFH